MHQDQFNLFSGPKSFLTETRPKDLQQIIGQDKIIEQIKNSISKNGVHFVLWGNPGCGKTTICRCIENKLNLPIRYYNPVHQTLSELKKIQAEMQNNYYLLSIDEIHRMDKKQQEFLLPYLEENKFKLIATTTENPFTFFTKGIISRITAIRINDLNPKDITDILVSQKNSSLDLAQKIGELDLKDARKAILLFEECKNKDSSQWDQIIADNIPYTVFDKNRHYDLLSAIIKSMRDNEIEEANQWLAYYLIEGGDLMVICRRLMIFASEDIGEAAPYALMKAVACTQAVEKIGMPEAQIILGDCVSFLAKSPKSRANYERIQNHLQKAKEVFNSVPAHRRNRKS